MTALASAPAGPLDRLLRLFADVHPGEGGRLLLLARNLFLLLAAYYVMTPVREVLILAAPGGAELKSYAYGAQALLLLGLVPAYSALATRLPRRRLINVVSAFFILCLPVFYRLARAQASIGLVFFLWIGVFSLMVVAQFWAYAHDVYTPDAGKRLFAVIAFGASAGAVAGAWISGHLIDVLGVNEPLLAAAAILAASQLLFNLIDLRGSEPTAGTARKADVAIAGDGAFALLLRSRYLLLMAALMLLLSWVNSAGEYILSAVVTHTADAEIAAGTLAAGDRGHFIGAFFSDYFQLVNVIGLLLHLFVVARLVQWVGVPVALCVLPAIALGSYAVAALLPSLAILRWVKTAENSVDYSLMNTVRQMLFLPTTREEKFKVKQAIDGLVVRAGDVLSALTVYVGTTFFALGVAGFAWINVALVLLWLALAVATGIEFRRRSAPVQK
ncbi:MAG: translocase [Betaproteobacteria bacterium]